MKESQRVPPPFLLEELCHRNTASVLYHADQMPLLKWGTIEVEGLGDGVYQVTAKIENTRLIPMRSAQARRRNVGLPDRASIAGEELTVLGEGRLANKDFGRLEPVEHNPDRLCLPGGGGRSIERVRWFVEGSGEATITFEAEKGGSLEATIELE